MLDSYTIIAAGCALLILLGAVFALLWMRDRSSIWLLWWGVPFLFGGATLGLFLRSDWDTDTFAILIGNGVRVAALAGLWQGLRVFERRRPLLGVLALVPLAWVAFCLLPGLGHNLLLRVEFITLINAGLCAACAFEIWRDRRDQLSSRLPLMLVFASFALAIAGRGALPLLMPLPVREVMVDPDWLGIFMFLVFAHATFAAVLFIAMTKERREAEQRSFALSDPLTGLLNRRAFAEFAMRLERRPPGDGGALALMVLDIDRFKSINDRFGHEVGDLVLKLFADVAEAIMRPSDQLFRMGGEEFCFVLPKLDSAQALLLGDRFRAAFERAAVETEAGPVRATVSIGLAASPVTTSLEVLLAAADAAVYEAKARGRNRIVSADPGTLRRRSAEPTARRLSA